MYLNKQSVASETRKRKISGKVQNRTASAETSCAALFIEKNGRATLFFDKDKVSSLPLCDGRRRLSLSDVFSLWTEAGKRAENLLNECLKRGVRNVVASGTDERLFGGSSKDFSNARRFSSAIFLEAFVSGCPAAGVCFSHVRSASAKELREYLPEHEMEEKEKDVGQTKTSANSASKRLNPLHENNGHVKKAALLKTKREKQSVPEESGKKKRAGQRGGRGKVQEKKSFANSFRETLFELFS